MWGDYSVWRRSISRKVNRIEKRTSLLVLGVVAVFSCAAATAIAVGGHEPNQPLHSFGVNPSVSTSVNPPRPNAVRAMPAAGEITGELLTLTPNGFVPNQITRQQGQFFLVVEDRSGLDQSSQQLSDKDGGNLFSAEVTIQTAEWQDRVELSTGTYVLTAAGNPNWVCQITITP
jgi:hypothetical protein